MHKTSRRPRFVATPRSRRRSRGARWRCATHEVADLKYNPGRYYDKTVSIDGVVTSAWGVPLMPFKLYKVDDGTGEVTVVAQDGRTPSRGAHVRVRGKVSEVATFGGQSVGLHLRQTDLDFKGR